VPGDAFWKMRMPHLEGGTSMVGLPGRRICAGTGLHQMLQIHPMSSHDVKNWAVVGERLDLSAVVRRAQTFLRLHDNWVRRANGETEWRQSYLDGNFLNDTDQHRRNAIAVKASEDASPPREENVEDEIQDRKGLRHDRDVLVLEVRQHIIAHAHVLHSFRHKKTGPEQGRARSCVRGLEECSVSGHPSCARELNLTCQIQFDLWTCQNIRRLDLPMPGTHDARRVTTVAYSLILVRAMTCL
jgi:hypothetical protein